MKKSYWPVPQMPLRSCMYICMYICTYIVSASSALINHPFTSYLSSAMAYWGRRYIVMGEGVTIQGEGGHTILYFSSFNRIKPASIKPHQIKFEELLIKYGHSLPQEKKMTSGSIKLFRALVNVYVNQVTKVKKNRINLMNMGILKLPFPFKNKIVFLPLTAYTFFIGDVA